MEGGGGWNTFRRDLIGNPQFGLRSFFFFPPILRIRSLQERIPELGKWTHQPGAEHTAASLRRGRLGLQGVAGPQRRGRGGCAWPGQREHARQGVLTTMDSSLAFPSQLHAVCKLHRSHQRGWFVCPGETPCVPQPIPPTIANCSHRAAL